jgi:hypothetical protein
VGKINHDKTRKENPAWSLGLKLASRLVVDRGPGPIYLIPKGMTSKGPETQLGATLKSRTRVNGELNNVDYQKKEHEMLQFSMYLFLFLFVYRKL